VREWLESLSSEDKKTVGRDVKLTQLCWPQEMPLIHKLEPELWEVESHLDDGRSSCVQFTVDGTDMILLHAFTNKSKKNPKVDPNLARQRKHLWFGGYLT
jgi:phage-related protein